MSTAMIQIRNVPSDLHRTLKSRAALAGMSLSDYLVAELRRIAERPSREELQRRLASRAPIELRESVVDAVAAERSSR
jgi:antitoxin FitA